ncbi:MAG: PA14 domain-containing protein [bacterium]
MTTESLSELRQSLRAEFPTLERLELVELTPDGEQTVVLAAVVPGDDAGDSDALSRRLVAYAAEQGVTLLPALYSARQWQALGDGPLERRWLDCYEPTGDCTGLFDYYGKHREHPAAFRRLTQQTVAEYIALLDTILNGTLRPPHVALGLCRVLLAEAFALLFATRGRAFTADAAAIRFFREELADDALPGDDVLLYFQLAGLAIQARHQQLLAEKGGAPPAWKPVVLRTRDLLRRLAKRQGALLTTGPERALRRRSRVLAGIGATALAILAVSAHQIFTWPERSKADPAAITHPGGIVGTFYNDLRFGKKVYQRTFPTLNLFARHSPAPGVNPDRFTVRWQGYLRFPERGKYYLCTESDDGVRLFFNHRKLLDDWSQHPPRKKCASVRVHRGWYPLKIEFFELLGGARMRLLRGRDELELTLVPPRDLCCRNSRDRKR